MEVAALNLITGEPTEDIRHEAQRDEFERIHFYGNNGWTSGFGNNQARRILMELQGNSLLDRDLLLGCMLAKGHNGRALSRLSEIIDSCVSSLTNRTTAPLPTSRGVVALGSLRCAACVQCHVA